MTLSFAWWDRWLDAWYGLCSKCNKRMTGNRFWVLRGWCDACGEDYWKACVAEEKRKTSCLCPRCGCALHVGVV